MKIDPFKISFPKQEILEIKEKVEIFPWHEMPKEGGWSFGTNIDYMKNLADYWAKKYDWDSQELKLNQQPNYKTKVDDIDIHFIFKKSSSPKDNIFCVASSNLSFIFSVTTYFSEIINKKFFRFSLVPPSQY